MIALSVAQTQKNLILDGGDAVTDLEQLCAAIQSGFDLLDRRAVMIEKMEAACRKAADVCKECIQAKNENS